MILQNMTNSEIFREIQKDYQTIITRYLDSYCKKYDKIRRQNPRRKREIIPISYSFQTSNKNNWILILSKPPADNKYNGYGNISVCLLTYYYTKIGIRVFKVDPTNGVGVFNSHFFSRYNERLNLGLTNHLDKVIHYFKNNSYSMCKSSPTEYGFNLIGKCKDGFIFGDYNEEDPWIVYKTFINNELSGFDQEEIGESLMSLLQSFIEQELESNDFNRNQYDFMADVYKGIRPNSNRA